MLVRPTHSSLSENTVIHLGLGKEPGVQATQGIPENRLPDGLSQHVKDHGGFVLTDFINVQIVTNFLFPGRQSW